MEVMIVDDEPVARRTVRECCEREPDLTVVGEYGDPRTALEAIRARPPHVLFLDIQMDSMSGLTLARSLDRETLPLIVFVTAYDQYALEAFEGGRVTNLLNPSAEGALRPSPPGVAGVPERDGPAVRPARPRPPIEKLGPAAGDRAGASR